jgi:hypothetical protein
MHETRKDKAADHLIGKVNSNINLRGEHYDGTHVD